MAERPGIPLEAVTDPHLPLPQTAGRSLGARLRALVLDVPIREAKRLEERITARTQIEVGGIVAGVRARLESHLPLHALPVAGDLAQQRGPLGWGRIETQLWEAPRVRKAALSSVRLLPVVEGLALVIAPSPELDYPVLACDFMALPARLSLNIELYGAPALRPLCQSIFAPLQPSFTELRNRPGPPWAQVISSGAGVHARVDPRRVEECVAALGGSIGHYLAGLAAAPPGPLGIPSQRTFFTAFHAEGPRQRAVGRVFGAEWAARYSKLMFE